MEFYFFTFCGNPEISEVGIIFTYILQVTILNSFVSVLQVTILNSFVGTLKLVKLELYSHISCRSLY